MPRPSAREKLLNSAVNCFHTRGLKASTIEDIAKAADVFKGSFYNHFKSKQALAVEVVKVYEKAFLAGLQAKGPPSALVRLRAHFEHMAGRLEKARFAKGCLLANFATEISETEAPLRRSIDAAFQRWFKSVAVLIRQAQSEGEVSRKLDADVMARFLVSAWEGTVTRLKVVQNRKPINEFFAIAFQLLLRK
jgi:TetR/AcrR family transcriptional regulator, transcriptional repressor for nem operon